MSNTVHLVSNQDPYGDTDVWCNEQFPREYSLFIAEVTCEECLIGFSNEGEVAKERLCTVSPRWLAGSTCACVRDHCTPEERAVIEAALVYRQMCIAHLNAKDARNEDVAAIRAVALECDFEDAVDVLLAARKEQE